jgi:predicted pyridoxine 5'-phosphate oxidase superfamily flavin-nucleotide-binding protein
MVFMPGEVQAAVDKTNPICIATVNEDGVPNIVYVGFLKYLDDRTIVIADNKFDKTRSNILMNKKLAFVVLDPETRKAYQIKGTAEYVTEGKRFEEVRDWVTSKRPDLKPKGAVYLTPDEIYCGAEKIA